MYYSAWNRILLLTMCTILVLLKIPVLFKNGNIQYDYEACVIETIYFEDQLKKKEEIMESKKVLLEF